MAHRTFQVITILYNNYNYYKVIINNITKLFKKRTRIEMYSTCQRKTCSYIHAWFYMKDIIQKL